MKKKVLWSIVSSLSLAVCLFASSANAEETERYIVAVDSSKLPAAVSPLSNHRFSLLAKFNDELRLLVNSYEKKTPLPLINGYVVEVPKSARASFTADCQSLFSDVFSVAGVQGSSNGALIVERDYPVYAFGKSKKVKGLGGDKTGADGETTPWGIEAVKAAVAWNAGSLGKGAKVAVLDTGIDHTHPDLKGRYKGGIDLINNDKDPMDDHGHGTHVSGTIAASANKQGVVGVAPEAELYGVKVLSGSGGGSVAGIVQGVEWAVSNKMDIISMSLGGPFPSQAMEVAMQKAFDAGVLIVAASGNSGEGRLGYPAGYKSVLAVGALSPSLELAPFSQYGEGQGVVAPGVAVLSSVIRGNGRGVTLNFDGAKVALKDAVNYIINTPVPAKAVSGKLMDGGLGRAEDFQGKDVKGAIVAMKLGAEITIAQKIMAAQAAGAVGALIYNEKTGPFRGKVDMGITIPAASLSLEDGQALLALVEKGLVVEMKVEKTDFDRYNGTSMACPHVSGVAALVKSANPALTNVEIRDILKATADDLGAKGYDTKYGNGLVNAGKAVKDAQSRKKADDDHEDEEDFAYASH